MSSRILSQYPMLKYFLNGFLLILISFTQVLNAQIDHNSKVVRISSLGIEGTDFGTGFIVGKRQDSLFILTARHVVYDQDNSFLHENITLEFYDSQLGKLTAHLLKWDEAYDIALLSALLPSENSDEYIPYSDSTSYLKAAYVSKEYKDHPIKIIGHPGARNWYVNTRNSIIEPNIRGRKGILAVTHEGISQGFSGSPIWNECEQWMGVLFEDGASEARAVSAKTVFEQFPVSYFSFIIRKNDRPCVANQALQDSSLKEMTTIMNRYISKARDLGDFLSNNRDRIFYGKKATAQLDFEINSYSDAYNMLNDRRESLIISVAKAWQEERAEFEVRTLLNNTLDNFHKNEMVVSNQIMTDIKDYLDAPILKKKKKKAIQVELDKLVEKIENNLNSIEREYARVTQFLSNE